MSLQHVGKYVIRGLQNCKIISVANTLYQLHILLFVQEKRYLFAAILLYEIHQSVVSLQPGGKRFLSYFYEV